MSRVVSWGLLLASTVLPGLAGAVCFEQSNAASTIDAVRSYIEDRYPDSGAGVSVLITLQGQPVLQVSRGCANCEWGIANGIDTAYRIGSISKSITAVEVLRFAEQNKLDLNAAIGTYLPDLPEQMGRVTAFQLMSHTSGLAEHVFNPEILPFVRSGMGLQDIIDMQRDVATDFSPGERYAYTNFNYTLLGALVEALSGRSYSDYMETVAFAARGLEHSANDDRRDIVTHRAQNYHAEDGRLLHAENVDMSHVGAAGQLLMSPRDLAKWFELLIAGELVSPEVRELAWTEVIPDDGQGGGYGLGFNVGERNQRRFIWHTGLTPGAHGAVGVLPGEELVVVILGNGFHLESTGEALNWMVDKLCPSSAETGTAGQSPGSPTRNEPRQAE